MLKIFGLSIGVSIVALLVALLYGGPAALALCLILGILEVSLSFDNAVVNASVLKRMDEWWQKIFLTVGVLIAVVGMRFLLPIAVVCLVSGLGPIEAVDLALQKGDPAMPGTYGFILTSAHPLIAGFGGMFLLNLFLNFILDGERDVLWLWPIERFLKKIGDLDKASILLSLTTLLVIAFTLAEDPLQVIVSGCIGLLSYIAVDGLGDAFESSEEEESDGPSNLVKVVGRQAFLLFLYLEVLDATFSFDGVIGAFAITPDIVLITLGLGFIGAMFVRSLTVYLVRQGTLDDYIYLEAGAHWAIGALSIILMLSVGIEVPEVITGLIGVVVIGASFVSSVLHNRREANSNSTELTEMEKTA